MKVQGKKIVVDSEKIVIETFLAIKGDKDRLDVYKRQVTMMIGVPRLWEMLHQKIMEKINAGKITKFIFKLCEKVDSISFSKKIFKKVHDNFGGNVRFFVSGGSKLDPRVSKDFLTLGLKVCEGYGTVSYTHL